MIRSILLAAAILFAASEAQAQYGYSPPRFIPGYGYAGSGYTLFPDGTSAWYQQQGNATFWMTSPGPSAVWYNNRHYGNFAGGYPRFPNNRPYRPW